MFTWGRGDDGRLGVLFLFFMIYIMLFDHIPSLPGHGDQGWKYIPKPVVVLTGTIVRHIACGSYHTAAISEDGELFTWGGGMYGKLGHGNETGQQRPTLVSGLKGQPVAQVTCGSRHTAALLGVGDDLFVCVCLCVCA